MFAAGQAISHLALTKLPTLPKDQAIAREEVDHRARADGDEIGQEIVQMELRDQKPHHEDVSCDRNQAVRQVKSE